MVVSFPLLTRQLCLNSTWTCSSNVMFYSFIQNRASRCTIWCNFRHETEHVLGIRLFDRNHRVNLRILQSKNVSWPWKHLHLVYNIYKKLKNHLTINYYIVIICYYFLSLLSPMKVISLSNQIPKFWICMCNIFWIYPTNSIWPYRRMSYLKWWW